MEPTIYKPGTYKTPGIYKGAGGIYKGCGVYNMGGDVGPVPGPNDLFWTIGNAEEDGKDKPIKGGLSSRIFDGTTFYKINEEQNNLFVSNTNNVTWNGGVNFDETPGNRYIIELLFKNIKDDGQYGHLVMFGNRSFEIGQHTNRKYIAVGFSNVTGNLGISQIYLNPSWQNASSYYLDYAWGNSSYPKDKVAKIQCEIEFIANGRILKCFVDEEKIFEYKITGNTFGSLVGTQFNNNGELCFGNIHIYKVT